MAITTCNVNNLMKSYTKQTRFIAQRRKNVQQSMIDTIRLSTEGKKRLFERMKQQAVDKIKIQHREK